MSMLSPACGDAWDGMFMTALRAATVAHELLMTWVCQRPRAQRAARGEECAERLYRARRRASQATRRATCQQQEGRRQAERAVEVPTRPTAESRPSSCTSPHPVSPLPRVVARDHPNSPGWQTTRRPRADQSRRRRLAGPGAADPLEQEDEGVDRAEGGQRALVEGVQVVLWGCVSWANSILCAVLSVLAARRANRQRRTACSPSARTRTHNLQTRHAELAQELAKHLRVRLGQRPAGGVVMVCCVLVVGGGSVVDKLPPMTQR
jgi:hypothetical protein